MIRTQPDQVAGRADSHPRPVDVLTSLRAEGAVYAGFWEFPGGKAHAGEAVVACAIREAREELGVLVAPIRALRAVDHRYPHARVQLTPVLCRLAADSPQPRPLAVLAHRWSPIADLDDAAFPEGNRPILADLRRLDADGTLARWLHQGV